MTNKLNPNIWNSTGKYRPYFMFFHANINIPLVGLGLHTSWEIDIMLYII